MTGHILKGDEFQKLSEPSLSVSPWEFGGIRLTAHAGGEASKFEQNSPIQNTGHKTKILAVADQLLFMAAL